MDEIPTQQVSLNDDFWSPRLELNARRAIFHQWEQLEDSGCIDNFRIITGEIEGFREGWFFADSDAYKWLDAAARIYATTRDPELSTLMDGLIDLLGRVQNNNGYIFTFNQIHFTGTRWVNLQIEHELYCHGHLIEAGVSHYQATGKKEMLAIARKAADLLVQEFLGAGPERTPGHEEVELALLRLYRVTGHQSYLDLSRHFLEQRGRTPRFGISLYRQRQSAEARRKQVELERQAYLVSHPDYPTVKLPKGNYSKQHRLGFLRWVLNALSGKYFQQHAPIRKQHTPVGHSVRFGYLETAIAMLQREDKDARVLPALESSWERMVTRRMYVTGGLGSVPSIEGFGRDYELDPEYSYSETCASLASLFWNWEMALLTGNARYSDLFEWQLYNAAAVGMGLTGGDYLYNNPLACRGGVTRKPWFAVPCCPSNLSRTWADLGKYILSNQEQDIWVHQYIGSLTTLKIKEELFPVGIESGLPWNGKVTLTFYPEHPVPARVWVRMPSWSEEMYVHLNHMPYSVTSLLPPDEKDPPASGVDPRRANFQEVTATWSSGDQLEIEFVLPVILRHAHPRVKGHRGKVAVTRGPLVYCLEDLDNPGVDIFTARLDPDSLQAQHTPDLLGDTWVLRGQTTTGQPLTFIPYFLWANRGESRMTVWVNT